MERMPDIRIVRGVLGYWERNVIYDVVLDDEVVGALQARQSFTCRVAPGRHRIQVTSPVNEYRASNVVEIDLEPAHKAELECSIRSYSALFNPMLFKRLHHIRLRTIEPQSQTASDP